VVAGARAWHQHEAERRHELHLAETALREGQTLLDRHDPARAVGTLERGLAAAPRVRGAGPVVRALKERLRQARGELSQARRRQAAARLANLANAIRLRHAGPRPAQAELRKLEQACRALWETRGKIPDLALDGRQEIDRQVATDLLDVALIWADTRVQLANSKGPKRRQALRGALRILADAERLFGPKHVLYRQRQAYAQALGLDDLAHTAARHAARVPPRTTWDYHAVGRSLYEADRFAEADGLFRKAVALDPRGFWPNFYQGLCAYRLGQCAEAVGAFRACISLSPHTAQAYYNRALAYTDLGQADRALQDYDHALELDPDLAPAALNRGILHYHRKEYAAALADLRYALGKGGDPAVIHYNLALVYLGQGDRGAALASLRRALQAEPRHAEARAVQERLGKER
jgi:tetratricopeptide (TPR) repeat protein